MAQLHHLVPGAYEARCFPQSFGGLDRLVPELLPAGTLILMPETSVHSGLLARPSGFQKWSSHEGVDVRTRAAPVDGTFLGFDQAFLMRTAGCPLLAVSAGDRLGVAHAGLKSLIDLEGMRSGTPTRENGGILHAFAAELSKNGSLKDARVDILFPVVPDEFPYAPGHPKYGEKNVRLCDAFADAYGEGAVMDRATGAIDLGALAKRIAYGLGFGEADVLYPISEKDGFATCARSPVRNYVLITRA